MDENKELVDVEETEEEVIVEVAETKASKKGKNKTDKKVKELEEKNIEALDNYIRLAAEFDNFRKRSIKEKDSIYQNATASVIESLLPVIDNLELANSNCKDEDNEVKKGFDLIYKQFMEVLDKLGVEEIEALDDDFDPVYHNAVMHVEDENFEDNKVVEVFQKGYTYKEKIIRHSMVKVAN